MNINSYLLKLIKNNRQKLIFILHLFLIFKILFQFIFTQDNIFFKLEKYPSNLYGDQGFYDNTAVRLSLGLGYVDNNLKPTMAYQIGYPLFIASIYIILRSYEIIVIIQILLLLFSYYLLFQIILKFLDQTTPLVLFFFLIFFNHNISKWVFYLMSETLGLFFFCSFLFLFYEYSRKGKKILLIFAALSFGFLILVRPIFYLFVYFILILSLIYLKDKKTILIFTLICIITIAPYLIRNFLTFNYASLGSGGGLNLYIGLTHSDPNNVLKRDWGELSSNRYEIKKMDNLFIKEIKNYVRKKPISALLNYLKNIDSLLGGLIFNEFKFSRILSIQNYIIFIFNFIFLYRNIFKKFISNMFIFIINILFLYLSLIQPLFISDQRQGIFLVTCSYLLFVLFNLPLKLWLSKN